MQSITETHATARASKSRKKSTDVHQNARRTEQQHQHDPMSDVVSLFFASLFRPTLPSFSLEVITPPALPCFSTPGIGGFRRVGVRVRRCALSAVFPLDHKEANKTLYVSIMNVGLSPLPVTVANNNPGGACYTGRTQIICNKLVETFVAKTC